MAFMKYLVLVAFVIINLLEIEAHGRLMDPVNRGSAFKKGFPTPKNWDDDGNYCGGYEVHHRVNGGKCGVCGDNYKAPQPRANENGGKYGRGFIVKTYKVGSEIEVDVDLTANHKGYFEFALCPLENKKSLETEECFDAHKLKITNGEYKYPVTTGKQGSYLIKLRLPENLTCEQCVLRWNYVAGNNWHWCGNGTGALGCGPQETFRTCSDIKIV